MSDIPDTIIDVYQDNMNDVWRFFDDEVDIGYDFNSLFITCQAALSQC